MEKQFIGDGIYLAFDIPTKQLILTTQNPYDRTNTIYLNREVYKALKVYADFVFMERNTCDS